MSTVSQSELEQLGRAAAEHIAGEGAVERVEVMLGEDTLDRPAYHFSFLINERRARQRAGLVRIQLMQRLWDDLVAQGDDHQPVVEILSREDWDKRAYAKSA